MIDVVAANRIARDVLRDVMKDDRTRKQARGVYQKVGSRSFDRRRWKNQTKPRNTSHTKQHIPQKPLFE